MRKLRKTQAALNLPTLTLEGGLFLPDQLEKAAFGSAQWQTEADYGTPKGLKLKDDYSRAFQIACAQWKHFAAQLERADVDAAALTHTFVQELLRDVLGFTQLQACSGITLEERHYPISLLAGSVPVVVAPHTLALHEPDTRFAVVGSGSRKKSAFMLAQELLNASSDHLWAIACNGKTLRLLRDAATLTRPSFVEIDLADLLGGQRYAEFANVWRLLHATRAAGKPTECIWEKWRAAGQEEGTRVRDGLRLGVTDALLTLGTGFIQHPANDALRQALHNGELTKDAYFQQLLRLIYRLIFLFSVEERGLLHPKNDSNDDGSAAQVERRAYAEGYAMGRLRELCLKRRARNRFDDHWQALRIVFKGLSEGEPRLALPALGGLFATSQCPTLDAASLDNAHLLAAMQNLRWASHKGLLAPVDYRNMGPEELGSVYESLLELVPEVDLPARQFGFVGLTSEGSTAGNARKLSGSYYTPDSLVQELIKSALDPVIEQRIAAQPKEPIEALLSIRVIDPACGSGHFLLAAARRLAEKLAQLRATLSNEGSEQTEQDFRHALREVVSRCIFGVDRNPMAIELARTALWLEGFEEGRPLGFLDHHLQVGDALLGLTDLKALELGIAKDAFKPLSGDDKDVCKLLAKTNAAALKSLEKQRNARAFGQLDVASSTGSGLSQLQALEALPENTTRQIATKEAAYRAFLEQAKNSRLAHAADLLVGAYLLPKLASSQDDIPTSATLYLTLRGDVLPMTQEGALVAAQSACAQARVLHWPLAFPQVFASGGFDCVMGNPPWEHVELKEEEFFASRNPLVADAKNKAERSQRIQWLAEGMLAKHLFPQVEHAPHECAAEQRLFREFTVSRRSFEATSTFAHVNEAEGGRYPLTGVGRVNTYALFSETIRQIMAPHARAGFIVPSGLATDNSTKAFFGDLVFKKSLDSFFEFENEGFFLGAGQGHMLRFALTTITGASEKIDEARYLFQGKKLEHLQDPNRIFKLSPEDIKQVNPNTLTCPIFQSRYDADLTKKIYGNVPVLVREEMSGSQENNPWRARFSQGTHNMATDSHLFKTHAELVSSGFERIGNKFSKGDDKYIPLYESKMIHIYNHRHGDFSDSNHERAHILPRIPDDRLKRKDYLTTPYYWIPESEVREKAKSLGWDREWFFAWRRVTDSRASARTLIATVIPWSGAGDSIFFPLLMQCKDKRLYACFQANMGSLILDYVTRQKLGGLNLNFFTFKQLPFLEPERYNETDLAFIVPRVLTLTYTTYDLSPWAQDLGYSGEPFSFDQGRRSQIRAELDAWYARAYGITRDELRFILDPSDVMDNGYPSETFAVLKRNEEREFGEYRTQRLVLEAWDKLEHGELY
ncbi:Eco57I restriction-modification methylase domain-containing protein [Pseudomonas veronii]